MSAPQASSPGQRAEQDTPTAVTGRLRRRPRPRLLSRVSIQSKLLLMLLTMTVVATALAGALGYGYGRILLRRAAFDRLTGIQQAQSRVVEGRFDDMRSTALTTALSESTSAAIPAFGRGLDELTDAPIAPAQWQSILGYYDTRFAAAAVQPPDGALDVNTFLPTSNAQKYLQANYTVPFSDPKRASGLDDARDGSSWSAANARFNNYFRQIVERFGFADALLIDTRGNVVYSVDKGVDLGTNVVFGPFRTEGTLTEAYQHALNTKQANHVEVTDFAPYLPAGRAVAWMAARVGPPGQPAGVLALQVPISALNGPMTLGRDWKLAGLGQTGETFMVGPDHLMRSDSRLFLEDPDAYRREVVAAGTHPDIANTAIRLGTTVLVQPVGATDRQATQSTTSGTLIGPDYLGRNTLQAYAPLNLPGLHWSIIASVDSSEAFAPEQQFAKRLLRVAATIILICCLASILWARLFIRPVRRLEAGARQISSGDYHVSLPVESRDEFGELTTAFNEMGRTLAVKEDLLTEQRRQNDHLLRSLMPESVMQRYRDGEETIASEHQDVTVIYADLAGLDEMSEEMSAEQALNVINSLVGQFDAAADALGVERVRDTHSGYLASCGLTIPLLDNIQRTVDFAIELQRIVHRFNTENDRNVQLRAGINSGTVSSGLVGHAGLVYDLWGSAVNLASRMRRDRPESGVYVTTRVYEATRDAHRYRPAGSIVVGDTQEPIWQLAEDL